MPRVYIIKAGSTFPSTADRLGDFDSWTLAALGAAGRHAAVVDVKRGEPLPSIASCAGVVVTGSHAMVTDKHSWSTRLESWIQRLVQAEVPYFGICYGHQLLAQAMGGRVGYHPEGKEIGTVEIVCSSPSNDDPLFHSMPKRFAAHTTHDQTVLELPSRTVCLAASAHEPHQAIRLGRAAWGVQFHPEYDPPIMEAYIEAQAEKLTAQGRNVFELLAAVNETPVAARVLIGFAKYVEDPGAFKR